jgi:calpain-7
VQSFDECVAIMMGTLDDVFQLIETAKRLEKSNNRIEAATKYYESCYLMRQVLQHTPQNEQSMPLRSLLEEKIEFYSDAAQGLYFDEGSTAPAQFVVADRQPSLDDVSVLTIPPLTPPPPAPCDSPRFTQSAELNRIASLANARLAEAIDLDEHKKRKQAIAAYMVAAETYLEAIRIGEKNPRWASTSSLGTVLKRRLEGALDRVEVLKHPDRPATLKQQPKTRDTDTVSTQEATLSKEEIAVLKRSSLIASGLFLPWSQDEAEELSRQVHVGKKHSLWRTNKIWIDPDGDLTLSEKQKQKFSKWARPNEIVRLRNSLGVKQHPPILIRSINPYLIKQQYVTDCSFIASLCICALFEKRFRKPLVTSIIYPQDSNGIPSFNPEGKYIVKLWLNGVARQVVVDDRLPIDRHSNLLCSHTTGDRQQLELWVSIIEKAYMKLCGGYDFPGSNSGVDLFSLTGWIPERVFFPKDPNKVRDFETPPDRAWERVFSANSFGDCLITVSTSSDITEEQAVSLGLVTAHAYAVLDVFQSQNGTKLLQLKNPWAHKGWTGRYSAHDKTSWMADKLAGEVGYDHIEAAKHDDGVFWICWEDVMLYFRNLQLSWNPKLFSYRVTTHGLWPKDLGLSDDTFNVGANPQYIMALSDQAVQKKATIWVLISRHVSKQEQEGCEVKDFLTIHLVRNSAKKDRIWYPHGPDTLVNGAYTNNPHVLLRYDTSGPVDQYVSLVLSQHEKSQDLAYTLSCYCTEPFSIGKPPPLLPSVCLTGTWTEMTAGGPVGSTHFFNNPMLAIKVTQEMSMQLGCTTEKTFAGTWPEAVETDPCNRLETSHLLCPLLPQ